MFTLLAWTNTPNGSEVTLARFDTDEEAHDALRKLVLSVNDPLLVAYEPWQPEYIYPELRE